VPYLSALEVCSRQGAIQIHVYLYLYYYYYHYYTTDAAAAASNDNDDDDDDDNDDVHVVTCRCGAECCRSLRSIRQRARTAGCSAKASTCTSSSLTRSNHPSRSPDSIYSDGVSVAAEHFSLVPSWRPDFVVSRLPLFSNNNT